MKRNKFNNFLKIKPIYLAVFLVPGIVTMCRNNSRENLDEQISELDKKIISTNDFSTANVPSKLKPAQQRYVRTKKILTQQYDTLEICINQNDSLTDVAFNNYAVRVGRDFQMSKFLSENDIKIFQQYVAQIDTMNFIHSSARGRILANCGSLHDLSYFLEMFNFDSVNTKLENKLAWNFYRDAVNAADSVDMAVLNFENDSLNRALIQESELLNMAWRAPIYDTSNTTDSIAHDTMYAVQSGPNFEIPEFDSVRTQYLHNDSIIRSYQNTMDTMFRAEDSLQEYKQSIRRQRDSLIQKRNELEI